jgi:hypothetical protein
MRTDSLEAVMAAREKAGVAAMEKAGVAAPEMW